MTILNEPEKYDISRPLKGPHRRVLIRLIGFLAYC